MEMMPSKKKIKLIDPEVIKKRREEKEAKEKNTSRHYDNYAGPGFRSDLQDHML